jgi:MFS family permease
MPMSGCRDHREQEGGPVSGNLPGGLPFVLLAATFLFNLGQGILRPAMPLYLQHAFSANYKMVTLIPVVFGVGKWVASLPTGYLMERVGRRLLMGSGLVLIAVIDISSVVAPEFLLFLGLRAVGGIGWAMFATVATTITVGGRSSGQRARAVSLLMMSETLGLLLGSTAGGWVYQGVGVATPFFLEAACLLVAASALFWGPLPEAGRRHSAATSRGRLTLALVLRTPGVMLMALTNALLIGIQTGIMVFLFPLYLANRRSTTPGMVGTMVSLTVLGRLAALWLGGSASDRWGRMRVLSAGLVGYAVVLGTLPYWAHPVLIATWSVAVGAAAGFVMPQPTAVIGDRVPQHLHGVAVGWLRTATDMGHIIAPLVTGAVADAADVTVPFIYAAALLCVVAWLCHQRAVAATTGDEVARR